MQRSASGQPKLTPEELARLRQAFSNPNPPAALEDQLAQVQAGNVAPYAADPNTQTAFRRLPAADQQAALRAHRLNQQNSRLAGVAEAGSAAGPGNVVLNTATGRMSADAERQAFAQSQLEKAEAERRDATIAQGRQHLGTDSNDEAALAAGLAERKNAREARQERSKEILTQKQREAAERRGKMIGRETATIADVAQVRREARRQKLTVEEYLAQRQAAEAPMRDEARKDRALDLQAQEIEARTQTSLAKIKSDEQRAAAENAIAQHRAETERLSIEAQTRMAEATNDIQRQQLEADLKARTQESAVAQVNGLVESGAWDHLDPVTRGTFLKEAYALPDSAVAAVNKGLKTQEDINNFVTYEVEGIATTIQGYSQLFEQHGPLNLLGHSDDDMALVQSQMATVSKMIDQIAALPPGEMKAKAMLRLDQAFGSWEQAPRNTGVYSSETLNNLRLDVFQKWQRARIGTPEPGPKPTTQREARPPRGNRPA